MDLSKAFGAINRTQLWTTIYKKGIPMETISQIRKGRKNTMLSAEHQGTYGEDRKKQCRGLPRLGSKRHNVHNLPRGHDVGLRSNEP